MATSEQLSILRRGNHTAKSSREADKLLNRVVARVGYNIEQEFGVPVFHHNFVYDDLIYSQAAGTQWGIEPDGGVLTVCIWGYLNLPILITDNKKQGTKLILITDKKRARGNAVERICKYLSQGQVWTKDEDILPLGGFFYGGDFADDSYIIGRLYHVTQGRDLNKVHVYKDKWGLGGASCFTRVRFFTEEEYYNICYSIASCAIRYYITKYGIETLL